MNQKGFLYELPLIIIATAVVSAIVLPLLIDVMGKQHTETMLLAWGGGLMLMIETYIIILFER